MVILLSFSFTTETFAFDLKSESAIAVDYETGQILYEKNAEMPLPPASMSKIMTEYLVLEAIEKGEINWDTQTRISDYGHWISLNNDFSGIALSKEKDYSVEKLFESVAIYSDNAAVITLVELIAGSEAEFVKRANEGFKEFEMLDTRFVNATGINNQALEGRHPEGTKAEETNLSTAKDMAKLAYHLVKDYPEVLEITQQTSTDFYGLSLPNWNWMLPHESDYLSQFYYPGVDGIKTGNSSEAGHSFTGTVKKDDQRLISVVMKTDSEPARFQETAKLYDHIFETIKEVNLADQLDLPEINLKNADKEAVQVSLAAAAKIYQTETQKPYEVTYNLDENYVNSSGELEKNIKADAKLGQAEISGINYLYDNESVNYDIIANDSVKIDSFFKRLLSQIKNLFN